MTLQKDAREFIELPNSAGVRYVVVGGYAVASHGRPCGTGRLVGADVALSLAGVSRLACVAGSARTAI